MYSPRIYENQIPSLYHAAQNLDVPMTQLANSFVYYGLASGDYGPAASHLLPPPNKVLPEGVLPKMPIFSRHYDSVRDFLTEPRFVAPKNATFEQLINLTLQDILHRNNRRDKGKQA
jgi:hypothetical protein